MITLYLQNIFSTPIKNYEDYLLMQKLSEQIAKEGIDGLSYNSSKDITEEPNNIKKYGINYAVFNYKKCKAVSSRLHRVGTTSN